MSHQLQPGNAANQTTLENFRISTNQGGTTKPPKHGQANTTNLTLNMNFNLGQPTIQMQAAHQQESSVARPGDVVQPQRIFHSPRESQDTFQTLIQQQAQQHNMTPHQYQKQMSNIISRNVTPGKGSAVVKKPNLAGIDRPDEEQIERVKIKQGASSPTGVQTNGKVKKIKVNKLSQDQLVQVRNLKLQNTSASGSNGNGSHHAILAQEARTGSVGKHSARQDVSSQLPMQHLYNTTSNTSSNGKYIIKAGKKKIKMSPDYQEKEDFAGQGGVKMPDSDSKLGRKGERPTVAQILEIEVQAAEQTWMEREGLGNFQQQQQLQMHRQNQQPLMIQHGFNSTATSGFESLNNGNLLGNMPQTTKLTKNMKVQSGHFFEDLRMAPGLRHQGNSQQLNSQGLNLPQFKNANNSQTRNQGSYLASGQASLFSGSESISMRGGIESPKGSTRASLTNSQLRQMQQKIHQYNEIISRNAQQNNQNFSKQQTTPHSFMPLLIDISHQRSNNNSNNGSNQQFFSRLQQQFLEQSTIIRHPQMGELPVISMTQQQLNNMIQQAAQHRQNVQFQTQQSHQIQQQSGSYQQTPAAPGIQQPPQMAFAIQISDDQISQGKARQHLSHTQVNNSPMNMHQDFNNSQQQFSVANGIFLPSLRSQHASNSSQQDNTMPSRITSPLKNGGFQQSQAPVTKMRLLSRGKSVPRSQARLDSGNGEGLFDTIQSMNAQQQQNLIRQQQYQNHLMMQQQQAQMDQNNFDRNYPIVGVSNLTNSFQQQRGRHGPTQPDLEHRNQLDSSRNLAIPDNQKCTRNSMSLRGGESSQFIGSQGDASAQSRRPPIQSGAHKYIIQFDQNLGTSRNLATQSDRSSYRAGTQGENVQNQYIAQTGPLSDLIMTHQSNLNVASNNNSTQRKNLRNKSSITVTCEGPNESSHDVNGGVPYYYESSKIHEAMTNEELKQGIEFDACQQNENILTEISKKIKKKGRNALKSSQREKEKNILQRQNTNKASADLNRFGQRQFSQQPAQSMQVIMQQTMNQLQNQQQKAENNKKISVKGQGGKLPEFTENPYPDLQSVNTTNLQNLKPNFALKRPPAKKISDQNVIAKIQIDYTGQEPSLAQHGNFLKNLTPACTKYLKSKNNSRMTPHKYRNGISTRLLVARETFAAKRAKLPILIMNLDGVIGYFDEAKNYIIKEKCLTILQSLSHNFKIVGFSSEPRGLISRFGKYLSEFKTAFTFDAIYQIQRKLTPNQSRVNLTHIVLDYSGDEEEDLDLFVCSQIVFVTVDKQNLNEKFETMDLREVIDFDKEYLKGAKSPLILRTPHARCRATNSSVVEVLFQLLTGLLVSSKLGHMETTSFFTYNDRTKGMSIPSDSKAVVSQLIPEKMKLADKVIQLSRSLKFVMSEPQYGLNLHKGFKTMTEIFKGDARPDWLEFNYRIFKPLLPIRMRLQKITQLSLQGAQPPTGKKLMVRCLNEEATRKYLVFAKKNEIVRKHIRKYRARYWAINQIEDTNLDEESQDIVGDLLDNGVIATTVGDVTESMPNSAVEPVVPQDGVPKETGRDAPEGEETKEEEEKLVGGECSSSSLDTDSENEQYDEEAQAVKFKVIDIKNQEDGPALRKQPPTIVNQKGDPHKIVKIECRKLQKSKMQFILDFCSKKQNTMLFTTNQQQHLQGAIAQQIESNIQELVQKLNDAEKAGKKEIVNYDF